MSHFQVFSNHTQEPASLQDHSPAENEGQFKARLVESLLVFWPAKLVWAGRTTGPPTKYVRMLCGYPPNRAWRYAPMLLTGVSAHFTMSCNTPVVLVWPALGRNGGRGWMTGTQRSRASQRVSDSAPADPRPASDVSGLGDRLLLGVCEQDAAPERSGC